LDEVKSAQEEIEGMAEGKPESGQRRGGGLYAAVEGYVR